MKEIRIVPFGAQHVAAVAELEQVCFADPWTEDGLKEELDNACARFLTAVDETGAVAGYIGCHTVLDEGYIANVAVSPDFRRQGIGKKLVQALLAQSTDLSFVTLVPVNAKVTAAKADAYELPNIRSQFFRAKLVDGVMECRDVEVFT